MVHHPSPTPAQRTTVLQKTETWHGPLPPPAALQAFEDVAPGTAVKIIEEFQAEASHRRALEDQQARLIISETLFGQVSAIVFALSALAVAGFAAHENQPWIGGVVGGGVIVSGIIALRTGRKKKP